MRYNKYSGSGNFFSLPNEVFLLGLSAGELAVYSFLKRCENRKTHQCWPSIRTIGEAVGMSENTVRKYIRRLEERMDLTELGEKLYETARLRLENPELTLSQLAELCDPPVTKSCLNHRLRKLLALSQAGEGERGAQDERQ